MFGLRHSGFGNAGSHIPCVDSPSHQKNVKSPTADGAEIIKELGPFDESRVVISIKEIRCVFGGALEESASGVDWDDVAMGLKIVK